MADFVVQEPNCGSHNFYSIVCGRQFTVPETCGQPIQCSDVGVVHCNSAIEMGTFNESVATQVVNISPSGTNIGRRHCSYVPEAVQLEVDGINTPADAENQPLKDSSSASWPEDTQQITRTDEIPLTCLWDVSGVFSDNAVHLPNIEISDDDLADVTGCLSSLHHSPIPEKEAYPNPLLAVTPSGPPNTVKRKSHPHGNKDEAPPSEAPKKKCLWQEGPFADKDQEKRRKDALRAKNNRERNKELLSRVKCLEKELEYYKQKCKKLEKTASERALGNYSPA